MKGRATHVARPFCLRYTVGVMHIFVAATLAAFALSGPVFSQTAAPSIDVPEGAQLLLMAKGKGTQNYGCTDGHWVLVAPDAKLFDADGKVIGKHFAGPTWRLDDGSEIKGKMIASKPAADAASVPELLLKAVSGSGTGQLSPVAYIRRTETQGGAAPKEPCTGGNLSVPYSATYSFYKAGPATSTRPDQPF